MPIYPVYSTYFAYCHSPLDKSVSIAHGASAAKANKKPEPPKIEKKPSDFPES